MEKERIYWIDWARSFAIIVVVLCHAVDHTIHFNIDYMSLLDSAQKIFAFAGLSLGRLGVPFFLFISGYLLLGRNYNSDQCMKFWKTNFWHLFLTTEIWILLYNLFLMYYNDASFSAKSYILNALFLKDVPLSHMWYMQMILSVYIFIPFLANVIKIFNQKILFIAVGGVFFYGFLANDLNIVTTLRWKESLNIVEPKFLGGGYGVYLIIGYLVGQGIFDHIKKRYLIIIGLISYMCIIFMQLYCYSNEYEWNVWYNSGFLLVCSLACFLLVKKWNPGNLKIITTIAKFAFGIYLVHNPIMMIAEKYMLTENLYIRSISLFGVTFVCSFVLVYAFSRINRIGRYLFMIK